MILAGLCGISAHAEEIEKKFRIGIGLEGYNTLDQEHSASANVRGVFDTDGEPLTAIFDPRNDSGAISDFGIEPQMGIVFNATYAFSRMWYLEGSVGYRRGDVGNVEVQTEFFRKPIPPEQPFGFTITNIQAGTLTEIPIQLTAGVRFRPRAAVNPYLGAGFGYLFTSYETSSDINTLSRRLDDSIGGFRRLSGGIFDPATSYEDLSGITVDAPNAPEWHLNGGVEFSFAKKWVVFVDARYTVYSGQLKMTINGSNELGISVPSDTVNVDDPGAFGPFGTVEIPTGGLLDGGSLEPLPTAPPGTDCAISPSECQLTGPHDGIPDAGLYYIHAGDVRYDGVSLQIGVRFTF